MGSEVTARNLARLSLANSSTTADRKLLIAVDFGTTFSGVAWAQTRQPGELHTIELWPDESSEDLEGTSNPKVPTAIRYLDNDAIEWGFQVGEKPCHRLFKVPFDPSQKFDPTLDMQYPVRNAHPPTYDLSVRGLVIDYLTALRKYVIMYLENKVSKAAIRSTSIEYIITTPAVWKEGAKSKFRKCAREAGMGKGESLHIMSEPEAAATHAFHTMHPHDLKVGDTFVLCDAGGGTVDLISYTLSSLTPILKVDEAAPGDGALCGSSFLNRIFEKHLIERCESNPGWDEEVLEDAMNRFENRVKRQFTGNLDKNFSIPVPGLDDDEVHDIRRGKLNLTGTQIRSIFDPVFGKIIDLVRKQIEATRRHVKAVLLVGGFGQSAYLRETLRRALGRSVKVMVPQDGWTAVVRGALLRGLAKSDPFSASMRVGSRSARKHYGKSSKTRFKPEIHDKSRRFWSDFRGEYRINAIQWFINKGDPVRENEPAKFEFSQTDRVRDGRPNAINVSIRVCSDEEAPLYRNDNVKKLVSLTADLSCISEKKLERRRGADGEWWYHIKFTITMTNCSASTSYGLLYKGKRYESVTAEYV